MKNSTLLLELNRMREIMGIPHLNESKKRNISETYFREKGLLLEQGGAADEVGEVVIKELGFEDVFKRATAGDAYNNAIKNFTETLEKEGITSARIKKQLETLYPNKYRNAVPTAEEITAAAKLYLKNNPDVLLRIGKEIPEINKQAMESIKLDDVIPDRETRDLINTTIKINPENLTTQQSKDAIDGLIEELEVGFPIASRPQTIQDLIDGFKDQRKLADDITGNGETIASRIVVSADAKNITNYKSIDDLYDGGILDKTTTNNLKTLLDPNLGYTERNAKTYLELVQEYKKKISNSVETYPEREGTKFDNLVDIYNRLVTKENELNLILKDNTIKIEIPSSLIGVKKSWVPFGSDLIGNISGWKIHIFGDTLEDTAIILNRVNPVLKKWGVHGKVANDLMTQSINQGIQKGKASTLYITPEIIKNGQVNQFVQEVKSALGDYNKIGGIYGDKSIDGTLHYRYELSKPIDPTKGVIMRDYNQLYKPNDGNFNIIGNPDLFDVSKAQ